MKTLIKVTTGLLLSLFSLSLIADDAADADRKYLLNMLGVIESSLNEKQFEQLIPLLDDEVVVVFLNGEVARGADQVKLFFNKTLGNDDAILIINNQEKDKIFILSFPLRFTRGTKRILAFTAKENKVSDRPDVSSIYDDYKELYENENNNTTGVYISTTKPTIAGGDI